MRSQSAETHPRGFKFIFWGELAERSSYYGMRGLLALFLVQSLGYTDDSAGPIVHAFTAACYLLPLIGGFVADRWLGKFRTIIWFSVPYILGHVLLAFETRAAMYVALFLLAMGSGVIKPNISPLMGQMYDEQGKSEALRAKAFTWFYTAINIGAAASMLTLPWVRDHYGYAVAFMAPTVLMVAALLAFYLGKRHYPVEVTGTLPRAETDIREDRKVLRNIVGVFGILTFFWAIFDQTSSTWVFFARDHMELHGFAPDMLQGFNPVLIIVLAPIFAKAWDALDKRGVSLRPTQKMFVGFILTAICMAMMSMAGYSTDGGSKISVGWEMWAYVVVTMAELCISSVGLEMAYAESPKHMKSRVTAAFLFTVFLGNSLAGFLSALYPKMAPGNYFALLTAMATFAGVLFWMVGRRFERRKLEVVPLIAVDG